jgi:hypothetical protein
VAEGARLESVYTFTGIGGSNPSLSASSSETRQMREKSQIARKLCYSALLLSKTQQTRVLKRMNRTVKLYRSVKRPSGAWGVQPVPDNQLRTLVDLHKGEGNYYLAYYDGKRRQMPSVGRFADAAKLVQRRKQLDALASGVELAPEPEPKAESDIVAEVNKFLEQQQAFVGNDGYGAAKKSISAYRNRLGFYLRFLVRPGLACYRRIANSRSSCRGRDHALSGALEALTPSRAPVVSVMGIGR